MAFRSKFEESISRELTNMGVAFEYESLIVPYTKPQRLTKRVKELHGLSDDFVSIGYFSYLVDFLLPNGVCIETKGRFTASDRTKMIAVSQQNPHLKIKMLFQRDQRIHSGSSTFYSDWCKAHVIDYAISHVPERWLNE